MLQDVLVACRRAVRAPTFSLAVVTILALGVGATTTMVSILDVLLWRPINAARPDELISVGTVTADGARPTPLVALDALVAAGLPVEGWCGYGRTITATDAGGTPVESSVDLVTGQCLRTIGFAPALGRSIDDGDAPVRGSGMPVAIISDRYWQRMFGRDPQVLGRTLQIENGTVSVIGVMPPGFGGLDKDLAVDVIVPFNSYRPNANVTSFIGRLRPGHTVETVRSQLVSVWPAIVTAATPQSPTSPQRPAVLTADVQPLTAGFSLFRRLYSPSLKPVAGLAAVLLLLTCINVGGLLVSRLASHSQEIAVMRALGASSGRIARQLFAECLVLSLCGCLVGMAIAYVAGRAFVWLLPWGNTAWTAVVLSCLGVYALLSHSIARRTREIAIRIALGASPATVHTLIARHALALVGGGLAIGVPAALAAASTLRSLLFGVMATDALTLVESGVLLFATGVIAAARPALRAVSLDPMRSLRAD